MSKGEFKKILQIIKSAYGEKFPKVDNDLADTWYRCLNDLDFKTVEVALIEYIKSKPFPPTISDVRTAYSVHLLAYGKVIESREEEVGDDW